MNILSRFPLLILLFALSLFSGAHVATAATANGNNVTGNNVTTIYTDNPNDDVFSKEKNSRWVLTSSGVITQKYYLVKRSFRWVTLKHRTDDGVKIKFDMVDGDVYRYSNDENGIQQRITLDLKVSRATSW